MTNRHLTKVVSDLEVKAMLFDMDIDWETLSLMPISTYQDAIWIRRWKEKEASSDRTPEDYEGGKDEYRG